MNTTMNGMQVKCGVLIIGAKGAVATTVMAAQCAAKNDLGYVFRVPSENDPAYKDIPLLDMDSIVFGGWDITNHSYSESCRIHNVIPPHNIDQIQDRIDKNKTYPAVMVRPDNTMESVLRTNVSQKRMQDIDYTTTVFTKRPLTDMVKSLSYDIEDFRTSNNLEKIVVVNLSSTEKDVALGPEHETLENLEQAIKDNSPNISDGILYAYAAIDAGCHFINFTPSIAAEIPAIVELARQRKVCISGKDGKTGQTLYKTVLAPFLKARGLKLTGWYSTNILGNRDGQVLNDPAHKAQKIQSKSGVLASILGYSDFDHQVHIHYYLPRGDAKEAWDNIDFTGWFDRPMQMKIDWLGDDSILAAPLVYDLIRWTDFFSTQGEYGLLTQLASYFKSPYGTDEHDFFQQLNLLKKYVQEKYS